jgi:hypothetical protein
MEESMMKHNNLIQTIIYLLLFLSITIVPGCKKSSTEPEPAGEDKSELLVNSLSVALVPGGEQTVIVTAFDKDGNPGGFSVSSENSGIASVSKSDSIFTITGVDYGSTTITVTSFSGKSQEIPVKIYNPKILETDELLITFSQTFDLIGSLGFPFSTAGSFYNPVSTTDGFKPLGSLCISGTDNPDGTHGVMLVKAKDGSDALAAPVDYTLLWASDATGGISLWVPVPPDGYKAMGLVAHSGTFPVKPSLDAVVCVREDLTVPGDAGEIVYQASNPFLSGVPYFRSWKIEPPISGPHENAYLSTGTFIAAIGSSSYPDPPSANPVMNVLNVQLPMLTETPYQQYVPKLTSFDPPPEETVPILARSMLVPCTIVNDSLYAGDPSWRFSHSPFYVLERQVFYELRYHNYNQTSVLQHNSYTKKYGVTTTESQKFWSETGVSVSVEGGISIGIFSGKVTATVSTSFGYSTMTSVAELQEDDYTSSIDSPPGKAVAIWQRYNRFVLKRLNGTSLEPVAVWEFGINSFVTDEYPDE